MTVSPWTDPKASGNRLAAHGLKGLLSIDLEGKTRIGAVGAVHTDESSTYAWKGDAAGLQYALSNLERFSAGATCLVGHNIIEHDLALLSKHNPNLELNRLPAIDTLYLSPLAFPENPYHSLVKQYQEPALARVQVNDPLLDAELTLELLADIVDALKSKQSDLLVAWHALLATGVKGHAFDHFFRIVRGVEASPSIADVTAIVERILAEHGCPAHASEIVGNAQSHPLPLTYLLAWLPAARAEDG